MWYLFICKHIPFFKCHDFGGGSLLDNLYIPGNCKKKVFCVDISSWDCSLLNIWIRIDGDKDRDDSMDL